MTDSCETVARAAGSLPTSSLLRFGIGTAKLSGDDHRDMYGTVLVAFDGSENAHRALDHAVELAGIVNATLHVVRVVEARDNPMKFGVVEVDELNRTEADLVDEIAAYRVDDIEGAIRRGDPVEVLLEYADEVDADLIVVGQDRTDGLEAAVFGRTADRLVRATDVPLIVVPR